MKMRSRSSVVKPGRRPVRLGAPNAIVSPTCSRSFSATDSIRETDRGITEGGDASPLGFWSTIDLITRRPQVLPQLSVGGQPLTGLRARV